MGLADWFRRRGAEREDDEPAETDDDEAERNDEEAEGDEEDPTVYPLW